MMRTNTTSTTSTSNRNVAQSGTERQAAIERIEEALQAIRAGRIILVRDDEGRENEGDLLCAAQHATAENIAFMAVHGRGLICHPVTAEMARRLNLNPMAPVNTESHGTAFTVSVDAAAGITTGISAADRARTIAVTIAEETVPEDLRRPGHVFPLVAREGGVLVRKGHTEAAVDLARLAGLVPSGVICEVLNDDGTMARGPELEALAQRHEMLLVSVEDLITYRDAVGDIALEESTVARMPTAMGEFTVTAYRTGDPVTPEILLLEHEGPTRDGGARNGSTRNGSVPIVRVHSECLTGEALHSLRCDCGAQLDESMRAVAAAGGAIVYLRQEGRGIGLFEKIRAYTLQDQGMDTVDANLALGHEVDLRRFGAAAAVLRRRGYREVRLLTNNPEKIDALQAGGVTVRERIPLLVGHSHQNREYRNAKAARLGHLFEASEAQTAQTAQTA
jgi:3,4-dihydroxy 2-butanone 4-phosphate synthase / GTP cyclohydrolase II